MRRRRFALKKRRATPIFVPSRLRNRLQNSKMVYQWGVSQGVISPGGEITVCGRKFCAISALMARPAVAKEVAIEGSPGLLGRIWAGTPRQPTAFVILEVKIGQRNNVTSFRWGMVGVVSPPESPFYHKPAVTPPGFFCSA